MARNLSIKTEGDSMSNLASLIPLGLSILLTVSPFFCLAETGGSGTGGGSSIRCTRSGSQFPVDGWYFLDYTLIKDSDGSPYVYNNSAIDHLNKVKSVFESGFDVLFSNTKKSVHSKSTDPTTWKSIPYPLRPSEPLHKNLENLVPKNCHKASLKQIVTYLPNENEFVQDGVGLAELKQTGTAQISFLYIHEMLRYYSSNKLSLLDIVAWTNIIHSEKFFNPRNRISFEYVVANGLKMPWIEAKSDIRDSEIEQIRAYFEIMEKIFPTRDKVLTPKSLEIAYNSYRSYNSNAINNLNLLKRDYDYNNISAVVAENQCGFFNDILEQDARLSSAYSPYRKVSRQLQNTLAEMHLEMCVLNFTEYLNRIQLCRNVREASKEENPIDRMHLFFKEETFRFQNEQSHFFLKCSRAKN